jgi:hypothetical protein
VTLVIAYAAIGCTFAIAFVTAGIHRMDPQAKRAGLGFRAIILPGVAALWPWLLYRWLQSIRHTDEEPPQ